MDRRTVLSIIFGVVAGVSVPVVAYVQAGATAYATLQDVQALLASYDQTRIEPLYHALSPVEPCQPVSETSASTSSDPFALCGNNICEAGESGEVAGGSQTSCAWWQTEATCHAQQSVASGTCPSDCVLQAGDSSVSSVRSAFSSGTSSVDGARECSPILCSDGRAFPRCNANGVPIHYFLDPCTSLSSSSAITQANCRAEQQSFEQTVAQTRSCVQDSDCTIVSQSCPYVTCGVAVAIRGEAQVRAAAEEVVRCMQKSGAPVACAACRAVEARCMLGMCEIVEAMPR